LTTRVSAHAADPEHVLDHAVRAALLGPHAHLAQRRGRVLRYPVDVSPFVAFPDDPDDADWRDLAALVGPGAVAGLAAAAVPDGWEVVFHLDGVQMVDDGVAARPDPEAVVLGPADVPEMLALVERTRPGPFLPRTIAMGTYLGIRRAGRLVAMAGERMHPPGWTEISAVCTEPEQRGQGLATRLVLAVAAGVRDRGDTPFLHAAATNVNAIRLYASLGFRVRRPVMFGAVRTPVTDAAVA
jgi:ribosomal protein S18 acetylase RimI-like enzyme